VAIDLYELALRFKSEGFPALKKQLDTMDKQGQTLATRFSGLQKALTGVASAAVVVAAGKFLANAIQEATEAERVLSELRQTVNNAGGDFEKLAPTLDVAANKMAKLSRFSDDAARGALTRMVQISGDTKGALDNLGLAADIAAARHIKLEEAAEIVAKTMTGNTRALKEFGISTKDSSKALEELRGKFRGMAEGDAATLQGRMEQLRNAWGEVLEAAGKAVTGTNSLPDALGRITEGVIDLSEWIDRNASKWQGWAAKVSEYLDGVERRGNKLRNVLIGIDRFFGNGNMQAVDGPGSRGGGGGGGRDAPIPGFVSPTWGTGGGFGGIRGWDQGHSTPPPGGTGTGKGPKIPDFSMGGTGQAQLESIGSGLFAGNPFDTMGRGGGQFGMTPEQLAEIFKKQNEALEEESKRQADKIKEHGDRIAAAAATVAGTIQSGLASTLGDAIYNGFAAAFSGEGLGSIFEGLLKTVLAGVGQMFTQLGMVYLEYGVLMQSLSTLLPNPFTAGPAGIAIGAALIAMGAALGAVASGGGGRGTATAGAFRERGGTTDIVRLKFVDRPGMNDRMEPLQPVVYNAYGPNDPKTQRWIKETFTKGARR
jgi:hypothetical protein